MSQPKKFHNSVRSNPLLLAMSVPGILAAAMIAGLSAEHLDPPVPPGLVVLFGSLAGLLILLAVSAALGGARTHHHERSRVRAISGLLDTLLNSSREWLWAVDDEGIFTFSSPTSATLLGYEPSDLIGKPCSTVIALGDLAKVRRSISAAQSNDSGWARIIVPCRHRNGTAVWVEVSGRSRPGRHGNGGGFEGTGRPLEAQTAQIIAASRSRSRIEEILGGRGLLTAFQPIHGLATGIVIGVEALTRFVSDDGASPACWFTEAEAVGLGSELEFAALESALAAADQLPTHLYVALNLSPATCLDPRLPGLVDQSQLPTDRIVLELTERLAVDEYAPLMAALAPLRLRGLRIAVDDAGSGFASMRHILHLRPDIIKLDRSLIAGIHDDAGQRALGAAMVEFARRIDATLVAEGIETSAELTAVTELGMTAGQGYFLGRPSVHPREWARWHVPAEPWPFRAEPPEAPKFQQG